MCLNIAESNIFWETFFALSNSLHLFFFHRLWENTTSCSGQKSMMHFFKHHWVNASYLCLEREEVVFFLLFSSFDPRL